MPIYELWADEAWTHGGEMLRYWCFFGGVMGPSKDIDRLETELAKVKAAYGHTAEIKWTKLKARNLPCYRSFVDCFVRLLRSTDLHYRQVFLDRSYVYVAPANGNGDLGELDVQFRIYYQFLKHAFGIKWLPVADFGEVSEIWMRLDDHSSKQHKQGLANFLTTLPARIRRTDLSISVVFKSSKTSCRLQIADLLMGAAGSHGNKKHLTRETGQRGMKPRQRVRYELAKYIYDALRKLDADERGSAAFNWFETTGHDGDPANRFKHKLRIWKFKPHSYRIDRGWQNDHLDTQGRYVMEDLSPMVLSGIDDPS
jgi:hypothetical protein